jgi:hypothetical protein
MSNESNYNSHSVGIQIRKKRLQQLAGKKNSLVASRALVATGHTAEDIGACHNRKLSVEWVLTTSHLLLYPGSRSRLRRCQVSASLTSLLTASQSIVQERNSAFQQANSSSQEGIADNNTEANDPKAPPESAEEELWAAWFYYVTGE